MSPCPYCYRAFIGWYPLKEHLLTNPICSILEREEQERIFQEQERKRRTTTMMKSDATYVPLALVEGIDKLIHICVSIPVGGNVGTIEAALPIDQLITIDNDMNVISTTETIRQHIIALTAKTVHETHPNVLGSTLYEVCYVLDTKNIKLYDEPQFSNCSKCQLCGTLTFLREGEPFSFHYTLKDNENSTKHVSRIITKYISRALDFDEHELPLKVEFEFCR